MAKPILVSIPGRMKRVQLEMSRRETSALFRLLCSEEGSSFIGEFLNRNKSGQESRDVLAVLRTVRQAAKLVGGGEPSKPAPVFEPVAVTRQCPVCRKYLECIGHHGGKKNQICCLRCGQQWKGVISDYEESVRRPV